MSNATKLSGHFFSLPAEARAPAKQLLRQIAHDVQSPLSTLAMEVFSIRLLLGKLEPSSSAPAAERLKAFAGLQEILVNMDRASLQLSEYLSEVTGMGTDDSSSVDEGAAKNG